MAISRPERPRSGMYLLDEDLAMDAAKRRALPPNDPDARFVLGGAGTEVSRTVVDRLANVEIADRHVRLQKRAAEPGPETTGPVPARNPETGFVPASTTEEGPTISTAALARGESVADQEAKQTAKAESEDTSSARPVSRRKAD